MAHERVDDRVDRHSTYQGSAVSPGSSWSVAGVGDFTGDGDADILWQNTNGSLAMWLMDGSTITSSRNSPPMKAAQSHRDRPGALPGLAISMAMATMTSCGAIVTARWPIWLMDGSTVFSSATQPMKAAQFRRSFPERRRDWRLQRQRRGRHPVAANSSGSLADMADVRVDDLSRAQLPPIRAARFHRTPVGISRNSATSTAPGDFDILWQQSTTGALVEWQMNGSQIVSSQSVTSQDAPVAPSSTWTSQAKPTDFT